MTAGTRVRCAHFTRTLKGALSSERIDCCAVLERFQKLASALTLHLTLPATPTARAEKEGFQFKFSIGNSKSVNIY